MKLLIISALISSSFAFGGNCPSNGSDSEPPTAPWHTSSGELQWSESYEVALGLAKNIAKEKVYRGTDSKGDDCFLKFNKVNACHAAHDTYGWSVYTAETAIRLTTYQVLVNYSKINFTLDGRTGPDKNTYSLGTHYLVGLPGVGLSYKINCRISNMGTR